MLRRTLVLPLAVALAVLTGAAPGGAAEEPSTFEVGSPADIAVSEAEREDLGRLAESLRISVEEATERFAGQELFAAVVDQAREKVPETFSTAIWTPEEDHAAEIRFAGRIDERVLDALDALPFRVLVSEDAGATEEQLLAAQRRVQEALSAIDGVERVESYIDDRTGHLVVTFNVRAGSEGVADAAREVVQSAASGDVDVDVNVGTAGSSVLTAIVGGNGFLDCTAGFPVTQAGSTGMSTAAHCLNSTTYYGGSYAYFSAQSSAANGDVQWHYFASAAAVTNKIRYTSSGGERFVTSIANPVAGSAICFWGITSGGTCGTVGSVNQCINGYCLLFTATPSVAQPGDSGGPWYWGNVGKGITHAYQTDVFGNRINDVATRIGALNTSLNVAIKITP